VQPFLNVLKTASDKKRGKGLGGTAHGATDPDPRKEKIFSQRKKANRIEKIKHNEESEIAALLLYEAQGEKRRAGDGRTADTTR